MAKHVILTLEYDMGDYSDREEDGCEISTDPEYYKDSFYQSDIDPFEINIVGVRIDDKYRIG